MLFSVFSTSILPSNNNQSIPLDLFGSAQHLTSDPSNIADQNALLMSGILGALQNTPQYNTHTNLNNNPTSIMDALMTTEAEAESLPFLNLLTGNKNQENNEAEVSENATPTGQVVGPKDNG